MKKLILLCLVLSACTAETANDNTNNGKTSSAVTNNRATTNNGNTNNGPTGPFFVENVHLPTQSSADASDCYVPTAVSGGDLRRWAERIVVVDVTSVTVPETFSGAESLESGLMQCGELSVRLSLEVKANVVDILQGDSAAELTFYIDSHQLNEWESQPRLLSQDRWWPDESAYHGDPWPQIQTSDTLGWTGTTGLQAGQRLLVFLNNRDGWTPAPFPLGEVDANNNVHFQSINFQCFGLPPDFQDVSIEKIRASLRDEPLVNNFDNLSNISAQKVIGCSHDLDPQPNDAEVDAGL